MTATLDLEYKNAPTVDAPAPAGPTVPDHKGIVETLVAVTGVRDDVGDVIVPGAFARTLQERKAKVCLGHDWNRPIGKTLDIKELMPGDPRLPKKTADGRPWPKEAGAVWARYQANLETEDGKAAFLNAKFFGPQESTYSIGYKTVKARHKGGTRYIDDLDLFEYGPVLHPANRLATLQSIKSGEPEGIEVSDILASWESVKDAEPEGMTFQDYSASLMAVDVELKARRYVQDSTYWGLPKGTLITPGMKPRGKKARNLRQRGVVPSRNVGVADKPDSRARRGNAADVAVRMGDEGLDLGLPDGGLTSDARVRARNPKGRDEEYVADLVGVNQARIDAYPVDTDVEWVKEARKVRDRAFEGLLDEGITPDELREDLVEADGEADSDDIDQVVADYTERYRAVAKQQAAERRAGKPADEPAKPEADEPKPKAPAKPAAPKARTAAPKGRTKDQIRADLDKVPGDSAQRAKWEIDNGAPVVDGPPGSGLFAYGPPKTVSAKQWTVTAASGLAIPTASIVKHLGRKGTALYPTSGRKASAWLQALADLRDADGKPLDLSETDAAKANAVVKAWRDADGRTLAEAVTDVAVPAYLRAIGKDDEAAEVERAAGIERPTDGATGTDEPATPDHEETARRIAAVAEELGLRAEMQSVQTSNAGLDRLLRISDPKRISAGVLGGFGAILTVDPDTGRVHTGAGSLTVPPERTEEYLRTWKRLREKYDEPRPDMVLNEMDRPAREAAARDERDAQERRLVADADDAALIGQYEQFRDMAQSLTDRGVEREGNAAWEMIDRRMALVEAEIDRRGLERPAPPAEPGTQGRAAALARIEGAIERLGESSAMGAITTVGMLRNFVANPDEVVASDDGRLASRWNDRTWVTVDTGTGQSLPVPNDVAEDDIPRLLEELAALDVPWGDGDAMRARWEDPNRKWADQVDVIDILSRYTDTKLKKPAKPRKTPAKPRETADQRRDREARERADRANREEEARRNRGRGVSDAVASFGADYVEPDITPTANAALDPREYRRLRDEADARQYRADEIERDRERYNEQVTAVRNSERMAADAPDTIPADQVPDNGVRVAGGRLVLTDAGKVGWALRTATGAVVASGHMFGNTTGRRVKLTRSQMNSLAERIAAITDGAGNRIPTTLANTDWTKGFRDSNGRGGQAALAYALVQWADANGVEVNDTQRSTAERIPRPPREPGVPDADGFYPDERALHLVPGDQVRMDDGTVRTVREIRKITGSNRVTDAVLVYWDGLDDDERTRYDLLHRVDVRHPYDPEDLRDPGMGYQNTDLGERVGDIRAQADRVREIIDKGEATAPGTRFVYTTGDSVFRKADTRPRVGTVTDRWTWEPAVNGWFQVVRYDDGTYDALNLATMSRRSDSGIELNPSPERQLEARRAWGLEPPADSSAATYTQDTDADGFTSLPATRASLAAGGTDTVGMLPGGKRPSASLIAALGNAERRRVTGTVDTDTPGRPAALTDADVLAVPGHENTVYTLHREGLANQLYTPGARRGVYVLNERGRRLLAPYLPGGDTPPDGDERARERADELTAEAPARELDRVLAMRRADTATRTILPAQRDAIREMSAQRRAELAVEANRRLNALYDQPGSEFNPQIEHLETVLAELMREPGSWMLERLLRMRNRGVNRNELIAAMSPEDRAVAIRENDERIELLRRRARPAERAELADRERLARALRDVGPDGRRDPDGGGDAYTPTGDLNNPAAFTDAELDAELAMARARLRSARARGFGPGSGTHDDAKLAVDVLTAEKNRRSPAPAGGDTVTVAGVEWTSRPVTGLRDTDERWTGRLPDGRTGTVTRSGDQWSWSILGAGALDDDSGFDTYATRDDAMRAILDPAAADPDRGVRIGREPRRSLRFGDTAGGDDGTRRERVSDGGDRIDPEDVGDARELADETLGLTEDEDGELVVTPEVAERQDRVERLIRAADTGTLDLTTRTDDELIGTRKDIAAELRLQEAVRRRDAAAGRPGGGVIRRGGRDGTTGDADEGTGGDDGTTAPPQPRRRPGLAGAAEDYAEALEGGDAADIERTRARLNSSLRRSRTGSPAAQRLRDHLASENADDPAEIRRLAEAMRAEARERRNAAARDRRRVKRLERERLRSLLGQVDAELRNRNVVLPDDGRADGESGDATGDGSTAATRMIGGLAFTAEDVGPDQGEMLTATLPDGRTGGVRDTGTGWAWFIRGANGLDDRGDGHATPDTAVAAMLERAPDSFGAPRGITPPGPEPERVPEEDPDLPPEDYTPPVPSVSETLGDLGALSLERLSLLVETLGGVLPQTGIAEEDAARMEEARRMIFEEYGRKGATRIGDLPDGTWFTLGLDNWDQSFLFLKRAEGDYVGQEGAPWYAEGEMLDFPALPRDAPMPPPPPARDDYPPGREGAQERLMDLLAGSAGPLSERGRKALETARDASRMNVRVSPGGTLLAARPNQYAPWTVAELIFGGTFDDRVGTDNLYNLSELGMDALLADIEALDIPWDDRAAMEQRWDVDGLGSEDSEAVERVANPESITMGDAVFRRDHSTDSGRMVFTAVRDGRDLKIRRDSDGWRPFGDFRDASGEPAYATAREAAADIAQLDAELDRGQVADLAAIGAAYDEARADYTLFVKSMPKSTSKGLAKIRELRAERNRLHNAMLQARELHRRTVAKLPAGQAEPFDASRYRVPVFGGTEEERRDMDALFRNVIMDGLPAEKARSLVHVEITLPDAESLKMKDGNQALANYRLDEHTMRVGKHAIAYTEARKQEGVDSGFWVKGEKLKAVGHTVTHEMGHHMDSLLSRDQREAMFTELSDTLRRMESDAVPYTPSWGREGTSMWSDDGAEAWVQANKALLIKHVSIYSSASQFEIIAELWTNYRGSASPGELSKIAGKHLMGEVS